MKFIKNNLKLVLAFVAGLISAGSIVYAVTAASSIDYTTNKNSQIKNVQDALNDLYKNMKKVEILEFEGVARKDESSIDIDISSKYSNFSSIDISNIFVQTNSCLATMYNEPHINNISYSYDKTKGILSINAEYHLFTKASNNFKIIIVE